VLAAIDGASLAVIAVGLFGLIGAVAAAVINRGGMRRGARADEVAATLEAQGKFIERLQAEATRLAEVAVKERIQARAEIDAYTERARSQLDDCEKRCRDCRTEVGELLANLAALRAIVLDEVAREAATDLIGQHAPDAAEVARIRDFIRTQTTTEEEPDGP
jgi:hypothetical protein